uniref:Uncharacterized protein n=1 Tax=Vespula pensylvanica TaxID=30213 RepID=A0A834KTY1_VESPE|nr:hypothetical protein H0235_012769 [Vespula pensylvanica]
MPVGGRVAGKVGIYSSHYNGNGLDIMALSKIYSGINEGIIWVSIGMGIAIAVLITLALCYIAHEKCRRRYNGYYPF